ncbi:hypothetical protein U1Q18_002957 [Sarracenia purpurea var. burkii]
MSLRWLETTLLRDTDLHVLVRQLDITVRFVGLEHDLQIFAAEIEPGEVAILVTVPTLVCG